MFPVYTPLNGLCVMYNNELMTLVNKSEIMKDWREMPKQEGFYLYFYFSCQCKRAWIFGFFGFVPLFNLLKSKIVIYKFQDGQLRPPHSGTYYKVFWFLLF